MTQGFQVETLTGVKKTLNDIAFAHSMGSTLIRIPIYLSYQPDLDKWILFLKDCLKLTNELKIKTFVCLHHPNRNDKSTQKILNVLQFYQDWQVISEALKDYDCIFIPINEPEKLNGNRIKLREVYSTLKPYILYGKKDRTICFAVPGVRTTTLKNWLPMPEYKNQMTEIHFYDWTFLQGSSKKKYPAQFRNKETLIKKLNTVTAWSKKHKTIVYIGETAFNRYNLSCPEFLEDFIQGCKKTKIPFTLHALREAPIWDYEKNITAWQTVMDNFKK